MAQIQSERRLVTDIFLPTSSSDQLTLTFVFAQFKTKSLYVLLPISSTLSL